MVCEDYLAELSAAEAKKAPGPAIGFALSHLISLWVLGAFFGLLFFRSFMMSSVGQIAAVAVIVLSITFELFSALQRRSGFIRVHSREAATLDDRLSRSYRSDARLKARFDMVMAELQAIFPEKKSEIALGNSPIHLAFPLLYVEPSKQKVLVLINRAFLIDASESSVRLAVKAASDGSYRRFLKIARFVTAGVNVWSATFFTLSAVYAGMVLGHDRFGFSACLAFLSPLLAIWYTWRFVASPSSGILLNLAITQLDSAAAVSILEGKHKIEAIRKLRLWAEESSSIWESCNISSPIRPDGVSDALNSARRLRQWGLQVSPEPEFDASSLLESYGLSSETTIDRNRADSRIKLCSLASRLWSIAAIATCGLGLTAMVFGFDRGRSISPLVVLIAIVPLALLPVLCLIGPWVKAQFSKRLIKNRARFGSVKHRVASHARARLRSLLKQPPGIRCHLLPNAETEDTGMAVASIRLGKGLICDGFREICQESDEELRFSIAHEWAHLSVTYHLGVYALIAKLMPVGLGISIFGLLLLKSLTAFSASSFREILELVNPVMLLGFPVWLVVLVLARRASQSAEIATDIAALLTPGVKVSDAIATFAIWQSKLNSRSATRTFTSTHPSHLRRINEILSCVK